MPVNLGRKIFSTICVMLIVSMIFQTVSAAHTVYTIEDNNANIILNRGDTFTISTPVGMYAFWNYSLSNPSILNLISTDGWMGDPGFALANYTFEGAEKGTTTLRFDRIVYDNYSIVDTFFLNVTSNVGRTMNTMLIIIVFSVIIVVPTALIIKWMKGEEK